MKIQISDDAASLRLNDANIVESEEVDIDIVFDFDENGQVVGVEILHLNKKTVAQLRKLDLPISAKDKAHLKQFIGLLDALIQPSPDLASRLSSERWEAYRRQTQLVVRASYILMAIATGTFIAATIFDRFYP